MDDRLHECCLAATSTPKNDHVLAEEPLRREKRHSEAGDALEGRIPQIGGEKWSTGQYRADLQANRNYFACPGHE